MIYYALKLVDNRSVQKFVNGTLRSSTYYSSRKNALLHLALMAKELGLEEFTGMKLAKRPRKVFCPKCGAEYPSGSKSIVCRECGTRFDT